MSTTEPAALPAPGTGQPSGPFLCRVWDPLPAGWRRTRPVMRTATCLAYDPSRLTVIANIDTKNHEHLHAIVAEAGFRNFQIPGTQSGFFARNRRAAPPPTVGRSHEGISR